MGGKHRRGNGGIIRQLQKEMESRQALLAGNMAQLSVDADIGANTIAETEAAERQTLYALFSQQKPSKPVAKPPAKKIVKKKPPSLFHEKPATPAPSRAPSPQEFVKVEKPTEKSPGKPAETGIFGSCSIS